MDNYILKLSGKAELPKSLEIGHNIHTVLEGSIVAETISDNEDGTKSHYYSFKPIIVETLTEKGERIIAKDTRSRSQQLRSLIFKRWRESNEPKEFDDYYDETMVSIMNKI